MSEYIITDEQLGELEFMYAMKAGVASGGSAFAMLDFESKIHEIPEIVRCRDCRYYEQTLGNIDVCNRETEESDWLMLVEPDGFCAWGERREP